MGNLRRYFGYREFHNLFKSKCFVTRQPAMLGGYLSRAILELPWGIGQNCRILFIPNELAQIAFNIHIYPPYDTNCLQLILRSSLVQLYSVKAKLLAKKKITLRWSPEAFMRVISIS